MELRRQGMTMKHIVKEMDGRTMSALEYRVKALESGQVSQAKKNDVKPWTLEENVLLLEQLQRGLPYSQIAGCFPERSYFAVLNRINYRETWSSGQSRQYRHWTNADVQRIVDMRVKEAKGLREIAIEFDSTFVAVSGVWRRRCERLITKEVRDSVQGRHRGCQVRRSIS
jgi:hypothetical protein